MKLRFQADADLNKDIVTGINHRVPEIDFTTADRSFAGLDDSEVLKIAALEGRVLVSHDQRTMPRHFAEFLRANTCPGVIVISQKMTVSAAIEAISLIWAESETSDYVDRIQVIAR